MKAHLANNSLGKREMNRALRDTSIRYIIPHVMIDLAILGLLDEQDLHGYQLKKQLAELIGSRSGMSFGSLYPALARLEKAGAREGRRGPHQRGHHPHDRCPQR